jgi:dienelactone hydrolase
MNPSTRPGFHVPWDLKALSKAPTTHPAEGFSAKGVKAVFFDALAWKGKPTRVFAWIGLPEVKPGGKVPGMVLVHGGGGTAFDEWVRLWTARGYAAISMDTCGCTAGGTDGKRPRHEMGGPPGWGGFDRIDDPVEDQWTYHAVADVVLAHSLLRSLPEVDGNRIGLTGISWGGYLACIAAGVDDRFRFAAPVYGCGFLGDNSCWKGEFKKMGEKGRRWIEQWDPSTYLKGVKVPMLWVTGTNDFAYPMDSLQKSYRSPSGPRTLCIRVRMPHGHGGPGENPEEIRAFADQLCNDGVSLAKITGQGRSGARAWAAYESKSPIVKAGLNCTKDKGDWPNRKWETLEVQVDAKAGKVTAAVPDGATVWYFNLVDQRGLVVSGEHVAD